MNLFRASPFDFIKIFCLKIDIVFVVLIDNLLLCYVFFKFGIHFTGQTSFYCDAIKCLRGICEVLHKIKTKVKIFKRIENLL